MYYLILHGRRAGYVRDRNTANLAVPLVLLLTDILWMVNNELQF
jgi:hypothetical protein